MDSGVTEIPTAIHDRILRRRDFLGGLGALALAWGVKNLVLTGSFVVANLFRCQVDF
jgi:hypothetical protein